MYICKLCKLKFLTGAALGGHSRKHKLSQKQLKYNKIPRLCKFCVQPIEYNIWRHNHKTKFCCGICRSKFFQIK